MVTGIAEPPAKDRTMNFPRSLKALVLSLVAGFSAQNAQAITPESGFWYNVNESGTGISIEITDNFLFMAAYGFDSAGNPMWYTAGNFMTNDRTFTSGLAAYRNGQAFGGLYNGPPQYLGDTGGQVTINFDPNDETKATISWFGRTYPIQRTDLFRSFYGTANNIHLTQRMLGEWSMVFDLYNRSTDYRAFPFFGDVLVFDLVDTASNPDFYDGCRPTNSLSGRCTSAMVAAHDAAGYYDSASGDQIFVVKDVPASGSTPAIYFAYYVAAGLTQFDGVMTIYNAGGNPSAGPFYPVRGFRTASRKYVVDGVGPNAVDPDDAKSRQPLEPASLAKAIRDSNGGVLPAGLTAAEVKARFDIDVERLGPAIKPLIERLEGERTRAE
jgi:hypothetical protein